MTSIFVLFLTIGAAGASQLSPAVSGLPLSHVRTGAGRVHEALSIGYQRSATFRQLVDQLRADGAVVYVEAGWCKPSAVQRLDGCAALLSRAHGVTYLRIVVDVGRTNNALVALIGHELQHAVEIVAASSGRLTGEEAVAWNSRRTGERTFETEQARIVADAIMKELANK